MSAEPIARVIADLRAGRARNLLPDDPTMHAMALEHAKGATVVDATPIYESLVAKDDPVYLYEDHPCIAPPWPSAAVCYVNGHGNVIVMQASADEVAERKRRELWEPANPVDWSRVRWIVDTFVWIGGRSPVAGGLVPTAGPVHLWRFAVYADGQPADLRWVHLIPDYPMERWDMAHLTLLGALNFMNCRNVELVEPTRRRAERRRLARTGVKVHTINVFPVGRSTRGGGWPASDGAGTPLTSVRGHFALYGSEHGRGLLFGKLSGRFWIPQHARGGQEHGQSETDYRLVPVDPRQPATKEQP